MELSSRLYLLIAGWGAAAPEWVQWSALIATQALLLAFLVLAGLAWWWVDRRLQALAAMVLAGAVGWFGTGLLKAVFREPRPCREFVLHTIERCSAVSVWSFPSSHALTAGAFAVSIGACWRRIGWLLAVLALLEAFLRVFIGVHYPHDVLAGLLIGGLVGLLAAVAGKQRRVRPAAPRS